MQQKCAFDVLRGRGGGAQREGNSGTTLEDNAK